MSDRYDTSGNPEWQYQPGMPALDFEQIEKDKGRYIGAIHAGHAGDYMPMKLIF